MKQPFWVLLVLALGLTGCSGFNKLLKSNDVEAKYAEAMRLYRTEKYAKAFTLFDNVLPALIGTSREDSINFLMGKISYLTKDYVSASMLMDEYRNKYTRSPFTPEAEYIYGMSFYHMSLPPEKDQTDTRKALSSFHEFMARHPEDPRNEEMAQLIDELMRKLYYKSYMNASLYYKLGHYQSAVTALRAALKEFPETPYRQEIMFAICKSWYSYAKNSVYARQLDRYLKMIDAYYNFKSAYPDSKQFDRELNRMLAEAQDFTAKNGVMSQAIETTTSRLEKALAKVEENKDKIFTVSTAAERATLRSDNKKLRVEIATLRKQLKDEQEQVRRTNQKRKKYSKQEPQQ